MERKPHEHRAHLFQKSVSFCTTLRDDGVSYGDYPEQLTYLIFLKMADEYAKPSYNRNVGIPPAYKWQSLKSKKGADLEGHHIALLRELATKRECSARFLPSRRTRFRTRPSFSG